MSVPTSAIAPRPALLRPALAVAAVVVACIIYAKRRGWLQRVPTKPAATSARLPPRSRRPGG